MRADFGRGMLRRRPPGLKRDLLTVMVCASIFFAVVFGLAYLLASFAARPRANGMVGRFEASDMTRSYGAAVGGVPLAVVRGQGWPGRTFPGLDLSVSRRGGAPDRVSYDVVATVADSEICQGAIEGGMSGVATLQVGDVVLPPPAVMPYSTGRNTTVHPSKEICREQAYPLTLKFTHIRTLGGAPDPVR